jgi:hypothetical protein
MILRLKPEKRRELTFGLDTRVQKQTLDPLLGECLVRVGADGRDPVGVEDLPAGLEGLAVVGDEPCVGESSGSEADGLGEEDAVESRQP